MNDRSSERIRIDKWLWHARLVKTRVLAAGLVQGGKIRINGLRIEKPGRAVGAGDVVTVTIEGRVRIFRIRDCGTRRGPAREAVLLYTDLDAPVPTGATPGEHPSPDSDNLAKGGLSMSAGLD